MLVFVIFNGRSEHIGFIIAAVSTGITLFILGAFKAYVLSGNKVKSGLEGTRPFLILISSIRNWIICFRSSILARKPTGKLLIVVIVYKSQCNFTTSIKKKRNSQTKGQDSKQYHTPTKQPHNEFTSYTPNKITNKHE